MKPVKGWTKTPDFDPNSQDPDPPGYRETQDGNKIIGPGSMSGGSKMTPQIKAMITGSGTRGGSRYPIGNTAPKTTQKIRG